MIDRLKMRRFGLILAVTAVLLALLAVTVPWKSWVETRLKAFLEAQGFRNVQLTVSSLNPRGIALTDISFGDTKPLHIQHLTLGLSLPALLHGSLREINLAGLQLDIKKEKENWTVSGLDEQSPTDHSIIPISNAAMAAIPFDKISLEDSRLLVHSDAWQMDIPLQLSWHKEPLPELHYEASGLALKAHDINIASGDSALTATLNAGDKKWGGQWHIHDIKMTGSGGDIPLLNGAGTLSAKEDQLMIQGQFSSADQAYKSNFHLDYLLGTPLKSRLEIIEVTAPWNDGTVSANNVLVPLDNKSSLNFNLEIQRVSLAGLLQQITGKETSATGAISGLLPVMISADGAITVKAGKLTANEPGIIAMPADAIPGDNAEVALTRSVLKNFHYTVLSIDVDQGQDNKLSVLMRLEGSNPDVYAGRAVKLNVHFAGDVLNLIKQNLLILTDPRKLLHQGTDAKH